MSTLSHCERSAAIFFFDMQDCFASLAMTVYIFMERKYYVYIATNNSNSVLYTGVTNNLERRMHEHKNKIIQGFTSKYNIDKLVFYEIFNSPQEAITAEKKIKAGSRQKKISLIESINLTWKDLAEI